VISTKGTVLGVFQRVYVEKHNLLHRAVGLFVQNEAGEVYVHRRAPTKSMHPNMYDMFVGGLVVAGETVEQGAR
jgi:isopentenyldiphosphate isomerase